MFGFNVYREKRRWFCCVYFMADANNLEFSDFSIYSSSSDKKALIDMAIRDWNQYWGPKLRKNWQDWVIIDVWEGYGGYNKALYARRYARRCPSHIRAIADDQSLIV